jgi:hypothetical protein
MRDHVSWKGQQQAIPQVSDQGTKGTRRSAQWLLRCQQQVTVLFLWAMVVLVATVLTDFYGGHEHLVGMVAQTHQVNTSHADLALEPDDIALNLPRLDSLAANLDLGIDPTEMDQRPVGILLHKISRPLHATTGRQAKQCDKIRIPDKRIGRLVRIVEVSSPQMGAFDQELSRRPNGHQTVVVGRARDPEADAEREADRVRVAWLLHGC